MHSKLVEGAETSALDAQIVQFISEYPCGAPPHMKMSVAIRNEAGELYRLIIADGIVELIRVDKFLSGMGCIEEFAGDFDALFQVPADKARARAGQRLSSEGVESRR
ncbi:hypothetical protein [Caballeronia sp. RCC_10]|uniref:hypothetical protein n=1 Tax=Caballeronia sp. RCC_10 TaxID=3239227 RepID=UPI003523DD96